MRRDGSGSMGRAVPLWAALAQLFFVVGHNTNGDGCVLSKYFEAHSKYFEARMLLLGTVYMGNCKPGLFVFATERIISQK